MAERRSEKNPCRHIPFDVSGETLDSLYRDNDQNEIEETVGDWRRAAIQRLEEERMVVQRDRNKHFDPKPRNVKRSPSLSDGASQVYKPGVSDGLSVDRRRQVLPISARSNFGSSE